MQEGTPEADIFADRDDFINRLLGDAIGAFNIYSVHIGSQLGYYQALADGNWQTAAELSQRTGTVERYTREWLEHQASACILQADESPSGDLRKYSLPPGKAEALTDRDSLNYIAPVAQLVVGAAQPIDQLLDAYRQGGGVPYADYGIHLREGQASINRPVFLNLLGTEWLPAMPDVHARLSSQPPARVADIGCGAGWSAIGIAQSYPNVRVDGYDLDDESVKLAQHNVAQVGLSDRVKIHLRDASDPILQGQYDLVTAFECLHDMSNPVGVLQTMRSLAGEKGVVFIMDERAAEEFQPCADLVEQYLYGFSILHCLPSGMVDQPSAGTGTVMRTETLENYALQAGFTLVEVLPIDNYFFKFYRLRF
jgi:2-polyprenyl-3-methyl-5-hydroxy-6-metoxy-1,4-benzoquinol methylase